MELRLLLSALSRSPLPAALLWLGLRFTCDAAPAPTPDISLHPTLQSSAIHPLSRGPVAIRGSVTNPSTHQVKVRVTTSLGTSYTHECPTSQDHFECRYPTDFTGAPALHPSLLYIDATTAPEFGGADSRTHQAEGLVLVPGSREEPPQLPLAFLDDFIDSEFKKDSASAQWPRQRALVNHFMRSRAARLMGIQKPNFDLDQAADFAWFKQNASLYDFDHRDRDWSTPLANRPARGFWQAVWNSWFNSSNDHPWDDDPSNRAPSNYRPYTFTNDLADLLILEQMLRSAQPSLPANGARLANEILSNLLALQHQSPDNFALPEPNGKQEHYTAGAFRYGLFESGEWLTEGRGWFANPKFRDFAHGGVFNGRAIWALGESLQRDPQGPHRQALESALSKALRFCLGEAESPRYRRKTPSGLSVWSPTGGEHAYLLLGMLAASRVCPELPIVLGENQPAQPLVELTRQSLDALVESAKPDGTWSRYANATAINLAALAEGVRTFPNHPSAERWKAAAMKTADLWLNLRSLASERSTPTPLFGHMIEGDGLTFVLSKNELPHISLYVQGHWLHALALLLDITGEPRYRQRADAIVRYYFGDNPLHVRLLNELGAVNNRVTDSDRDGNEDSLHWDAYPESTAFFQIGLLHYLQVRR